MSITRRDLLRGASIFGFASVLPGALGCSGDDDPPATLSGAPSPSNERSKAVFRHGVASGDPLPDAVILWTRVTPDGAGLVTVAWQIARDASFADVVGSGELTTDGDRDYTVKVDARDLEAGTTYYYRFIALDGSSPIGRTRTAPTGGVERLRFGVVACSSYAHGYFHAYRSLAGRLDLDAVLHLGDYIYEYGNDEYGSARKYEPETEILSLSDYRTRYAHYRRDEDLRAVHQQHPFIVVVDDHEIADDAWKGGAENHTEGDEGAWTDRKTAALRAHSEWLPIRDGEGGKLFRALRYGDLVDLVMLDTRTLGRDRQADAGDADEANDPSRSLLGSEQEAWLGEQLDGSTATWRIICQQVVMGQIPELINVDAWDGYPAARQRFFDLLAEKEVGDVVVLTGDIHTSFAFDLAPAPLDPERYDPATGKGALAVELVTPGVTSPGMTKELAAGFEPLLLSNPHIKYTNLWRRGYIIVDVTQERVQGAWFHYESPDLTEVPEVFAAAFATYRGENHLRQEDQAAPALEDPPAAAPAVS
jgi:alkaline phosphatase D